GFGSSIAVFGCGAVGLSAVMAARIAGCPRTFAIDVHDSRLELALELGATHAFNGGKVDVVAEIKAASEGGVHDAVETTGVPPVGGQSVNAPRLLNIATIVMKTPKMKLDVHNDLTAKGKTMVGEIEGETVQRVFIPQLVELQSVGRFQVDRLEHFYQFDQ